MTLYKIYSLFVYFLINIYYISNYLVILFIAPQTRNN